MKMINLKIELIHIISTLSLWVNIILIHLISFFLQFYSLTLNNFIINCDHFDLIFFCILWSLHKCFTYIQNRVKKIINTAVAISGYNIILEQFTVLLFELISMLSNHFNSFALSICAPYILYWHFNCNLDYIIEDNRATTTYKWNKQFAVFHLQQLLETYSHCAVRVVSSLMCVRVCMCGRAKFTPKTIEINERNHASVCAWARTRVCSIFVVIEFHPMAKKAQQINTKIEIAGMWTKMQC